MKVFTVIGTSGSGKTTTIEAVIAEMNRRGCKVGSVKEIHYESFAIDPSPASNTHRHRAAGAALVTARGYYETDLLYPEKLSLKEILKHYKDYDWVVLEGVDDLSVPALVCAHDAAGLELKWNKNAICVSGKISADLAKYQDQPSFNALKDASALCDFLEAQVPDYLECYDIDDPDPGADITLAVNGKPLRMVPFVQKTLRGVVLGVVRELEGYRENAEVEIRLK